MRSSATSSATSRSTWATPASSGEYDSELLGRDVRLQTRSLADLLNSHNPTGTVVLTLTRTAQQAAKTALAGRRGSVVVLDVKTGGIVAMYSDPTFDPNPLASHNTAAVQKYFDALESTPIQPDLARAYRERYPAGSTFKVLTTAVALDAGIVNPTTPFPRVTNIPLPQSNKTLSNFGNPPERCGGTLAESFTVSCNTTFARIGLTLGDRLAQGITAFGINDPPPPIDLSPGAASSVGPAERHVPEQPAVLRARRDRSGRRRGHAARDGARRRVGRRQRRDDGAARDERDPRPTAPSCAATTRRCGGRTMTPGTAAILNEFMRNVVADPNGTGTAAQIPGITVAGKTGTAQAPGGPPHAWFIAFAPAEAPRYAIAVIVERGGDDGSEATGGRVAAPVAAQVLSALLKGPASG